MEFGIPSSAKKKQEKGRKRPKGELASWERVSQRVPSRWTVKSSVVVFVIPKGIGQLGLEICPAAL